MSASKGLDIGMGATIRFGSDCYPVTVVGISTSGYKLTLQEDDARRLDNNGMSDVQDYEYTRNPNGNIYYAYRRANGAYYLKGSKQQISLGFRRKFYDFCF